MIKFIFKRVAILCYPLFVFYIASNAQIEFGKINEVYSEYSELQYDFVRTIPNKSIVMGINTEPAYNNDFMYKVFYFNNNSFITYKNIKYSGEPIMFFAGYDSNYIATITGLYEKYPIRIFKLKGNEYKLKSKVQIKDTTLSDGIDEIFFLGKEKLLLVSTNNFSRKNGELDYARLGVLDLKKKKVVKSIEIDFGNSILFGYFPKQWSDVRDSTIILVNPLFGQLYVYNLNLELKHQIELPFLNCKETILELSKTFNEKTYLRYEYNPKLIIQEFLEKDLLNKQRIEKVFFIGQDSICISLVPEGRYKTKRILYIYSLSKERILNTTVFNYEHSPESFQLKYTGGRYFTENGKTAVVRSSSTINKDSMFYNILLYQIVKDPKSFISFQKIMSLELSDEYGNGITKDDFTGISEIVFVNILKCNSCLEELSESSIIVAVDIANDKKKRILYKNSIVNEFGIEKVYFLNEKQGFDFLLNRKLKIYH
jgi:hypothetical protein